MNNSTCICPLCGQDKDHIKKPVWTYTIHTGTFLSSLFGRSGTVMIFCPMRHR